MSTEAGKRLLDHFKHHPDRDCLEPTAHAADIAAIEAEARRAALTDLRKKVAGMAISLTDPDHLTRYGHGYNDAVRAGLAEIDRALAE
jgi:hypothetical protein